MISLPKYSYGFDMDISTPFNEQVTLAGNELILLWKSGKEVWNNWVHDNPDSNINFNNFDFTGHVVDEVSFRGYHFPSGFVDFEKAIFDDLQVDFSNAHFHGTVSFSDVHFNGNSIDFSNAIFTSDAQFIEMEFNKGCVSFKEVKFLEGAVYFSSTDFKDTYVIFTGATFECETISFDGVNIDRGELLFDSVKMEAANISFSDINLNEGFASFENARMCAYSINFCHFTSGQKEISFRRACFKGDVEFDNSTFNGTIDFNGAELYKGSYSFCACKFKGNFNFTNLINEYKATNISFKHSIFEGSLDLFGNNLNCVLDLTHTKLSNQTPLSGLKCALKRKFSTKAVDPLDSERFLRLKEIALSNNDHSSALRFHASEMRAKRWQHEEGLNSTITAYTESLLDTLYGWLCDYGQSIMLPVIWFISCMTIFTFKYAFASDKLETIAAFPASFMLSISNSIPFLQSSKGVQKTAKELLFYFPDSTDVYFWLAAQGSLSFVFIFLIGLGLRNRFKI